MFSITWSLPFKHIAFFIKHLRREINQVHGTAGLLHLLIKEYLDMNFVKANYMAHFCLGGARKAALSQIPSSVLKMHP